MPIKNGLLAAFLTICLMFVSPLVVFARDLIPGGHNIGVELKSDGLMISGTYDVKYENAVYNPNRDSDIKKGDLLVRVGSNKVEDLSGLLSVLKKDFEGKDSIDVTIVRNKQEQLKSLKLIKDEYGNIKTGLFIKEKVLGLGTLTYYDPVNMTYGSLGHEMVDTNFSPGVDLSFGTIYGSDVRQIKKSINGKPGEKIASINKKEILGEVNKNNRYGVYGTYTKGPNERLVLEVGIREDVKLGNAQIWTVVKDDKIEKFDIEIVGLKKQDKKDIKGISFRVVDKRLLNISNGIVAGMSGSPIVQDNKIIGAVTHVLVDKVQYGHGIFIEWMLEESDALVRS